MMAMGKMRLFRNKKAIELTINFLVMLILAVVVFGLGMKFMVQFFAGAQKQQAALDQQTKSRIEGLLSSGERVAVPLNKKTLIRGEGDTIGIGISNVVSDKPENDFYVKIACAGTCTNAPEVTYSPKHAIENNKQTVVLTYFQTKKNTPSMSYIFNVCVSRDNPLTSCDAAVVNDLYDKTLHKVYITVP